MPVDCGRKQKSGLRLPVFAKIVNPAGGLGYDNGSGPAIFYLIFPVMGRTDVQHSQ
jgi:hypothetical protein